VKAPWTTSETIPADDRGYLYGDGLFETLVAYRGRLLWPHLHLERLALGMQRLGIPADLDAIGDALTVAAAGYAKGFGVLRLTLTRGAGPRGYAPPRSASSHWTILESVTERDPLVALEPAAVALSDVTLGRQPALAGIKHCSRLEQVLAAQQADTLGVDDVLMATEQGQLHSSSKANLFFFIGGELLTAACEGQGICGTRRRLVIEQLAPAFGIAVRFSALKADQLGDVDGAFLCNSVIGIRGISSIAGRQVPLDERISLLQRAYRTESLACVA